ncbi:MAG TPA: hypothetical protein VHC39_15305 [Rhizomicrobium sp.]|nr:hypothetical protein [Rhizomicrobium sp.]
MRISTSLIIAGATVIGLAGLAPTIARELDRHTVTVQLPGGGVETIEYSGKVAPKVSFRANPVFGPVDASPIAFAPIGFPSFAALDQISAQMDRQMNLMMHQAQMLAAMPQDQLFRATLNGVPQGATFSMVSESSSNGVCTHVTRITQGAGDAKPQVVSQTSGDCGQGAHSIAPTADPDMKQINYPVPALHTVRNTL